MLFVNIPGLMPSTNLTLVHGRVVVLLLRDISTDQGTQRSHNCRRASLASFAGSCDACASQTLQ